MQYLIDKNDALTRLTSVSSSSSESSGEGSQITSRTYFLTRLCHLRVGLESPLKGGGITVCSWGFITFGSPVKVACASGLDGATPFDAEASFCPFLDASFAAFGPFCVASSRAEDGCCDCFKLSSKAAFNYHIQKFRSMKH